MPEFQLKTPIAFIIFNRPDTTERVFEEIAKAKPPKLLVVGDGARTNRAGEESKVAATRAIIGRVDWDCEVLTNFSDVNLGCKRRVSSGIDWIFEHVEDAIILEDDCLPHPTFFRFCEELLEHYRTDQRISQISGNNFQFGYKLNNDSYYFSRCNHIWGWATWRDRWQNDYDVEMRSWPRIRDEGRINDWFSSVGEQKRWSATFDKVHQQMVDTWDYQLCFAQLLQGRLSILPNINLISNIGFGANATHTTSHNIYANIPTEEMQFPLRHPDGIFASRVLDERYAKNSLSSSPSIIRRIINRLSNI